MTVDMERWKRLRDRVDGLKIYERPWSAGMWAFVGLFGGSVLALIGWLPVRAGLSAATQASFDWVLFVLVSAIAISFICGGLCLAMMVSNRGEMRRNCGFIVEEMDEISDRWKKGAGTPQTPTQ